MPQNLSAQAQKFGISMKKGFMPNVWSMYVHSVGSASLCSKSGVMLLNTHSGEEFSKPLIIFRHESRERKQKNFWRRMAERFSSSCNSTTTCTIGSKSFLRLHLNHFNLKNYPIFNYLKTVKVLQIVMYLLKW